MRAAVKVVVIHELDLTMDVFALGATFPKAQHLYIVACTIPAYISFPGIYPIANVVVAYCKGCVVTGLPRILERCPKVESISVLCYGGPRGMLKQLVERSVQRAEEFLTGSHLVALDPTVSRLRSLRLEAPANLVLKMVLELVLSNFPIYNVPGLFLTGMAVDRMIVATGPTLMAMVAGVEELHMRLRAFLVPHGFFNLRKLVVYGQDNQLHFLIRIVKAVPLTGRLEELKLMLRLAEWDPDAPNDPALHSALEKTDNILGDLQRFRSLTIVMSLFERTEWDFAQFKETVSTLMPRLTAAGRRLSVERGRSW
ncbi:hypothetical protein C8J56DRAFT_933324 [Mycena floridula]|nr:hypothetical protein C8J56DRAFT_933324 [Mycena floridula]